MLLVECKIAFISVPDATDIDCIIESLCFVDLFFTPFHSYILYFIFSVYYTIFITNK